MEDKLSKLLYELNDEYIKLVNSRDYKRILNLQRIRYSLFKLDFEYLLETAIMKIFKNKYSDDLTRFKLPPYETDMLNKCRDGISNDGIYNQCKIVVYTCIVGGYDDILEPVYCNANCDYYVVTDKEVAEDSAWKKIDINQFELGGLSNSEKNRYIKLHPHILFCDYDFSLYVDGNIRIITDIVPLVEQIGSRILGVHRHNLHDCIYTEANVIMRRKRFIRIRDVVKKQVAAYKQEGFKRHQGFYENPILIRKHNDKRCIKLMESWWAEMNRFTTRDQLSLPYVIWKCGIKEKDICILGNNLRMNPRFRQYDHNTVK